MSVTIGFFDADGATRNALADPRSGDVFTNTRGLWIYVVGRGPGVVTTIEFSCPEEIRPEDGLVAIQDKAQFTERFRDGDRLRILLVRREVEVAGWLERAMVAG